MALSKLVAVYSAAVLSPSTLILPVARKVGVAPVVAVAARRPAFVPDPREVAAILEAPVAAFLPGVAPVIIDPDPRGRPIRYGAYVVEGRIVWGATAAILGQLGAVLGDPQGRRRSRAPGWS